MNSMLVSKNPHPSQMVWNRQSSSSGRVQCPLPRRRWWARACGLASTWPPGPLAAFVSTASVARKYCSATLVSEMRAYTRVMRGVRCPNRAAMASRLMPRLKLALGGQGVAKLVGVDVADAGPSCGPFYGPGDHVAVEGLVVGPLEQQAARRRPAPGAVVGDKAEEQWVQRYVAVVVELAHGDAEPVSGPDAVDGVVAEGDQLPDAHARAGRQLDHETSAAVGLGGKGGHELGRAGVV